MEEVLFLMAAEHTAEFLNTIHKDNDTSYITIATLSKKEKWNQYHYRGKDKAIQKAIELTNSKVNVYHSNNSFYKPQRGKATLYNINALYIDLDCHEHEFNLDQAMFWLKSEYFETKIPTPTYTVFTGRGLQLYWCIETAPKQALYLWLLIQTRLSEELSTVGEFVTGLEVDSSSVDDPSRVFRVAGTLNTRANQVARIVDHLDYRYTMSEIRDNYFPDLAFTQSKDAYKPKITQPKKSSNNEGKIKYLYQSYTLQCARINDLTKLIELRNGDMKGYRDELLCIYGWTSVNRKSSLERFLMELESVNALFSEPLSDSEIEYKASHIYNKYKSKVLKKENPKHYYENFDVYIFKNDTIIKKLKITEEEQKHMTTIIAKREKYDRNNAKRKQSRRNEQGLTKRQQAKQDTRHMVQELKSQGLKQKQVAEQLGLGIATVKRHWK